MLGLGLVAFEARTEVGLVVWVLVWAEDAILPFTIALVGCIVGTPTPALLHDRIAAQIGLEEPSIGSLDGIAIGTELGIVQHSGEHRAVRHRLALARRCHGGRKRVELVYLLV